MEPGHGEVATRAIRPRAWLDGLTDEEARDRLARDGPNDLPRATGPSLGTLVLRQLRSFIVLLLLAAAIISLALGETGDGLAILVAVFLNAGVGLFMDVRAERSMSALAALAAPTARVRRSGVVREVPVRELVRGDLLLVEPGDRAGADARLVGGECEVDESLLTGESVAIPKHAGDGDDALRAGTLVTRGAAQAIVVETGAATQVGRIGLLLAEARRPAFPLARRLESLGRYLVWTVAAVALVIVVLGLLQGRAFWPLVEVAIVLAIAAIPEGLPAVATLALAAGAWRLSRRGVLLRQLGALEALGAVTTLCLDKTGTLTANAMTVRALLAGDARIAVTGAGWAPDGELRVDGRRVDVDEVPGLRALLEAGQRCNDATHERHDGEWHIHGDPAEGALLVAAAKAGLADGRREEPRLAQVSAGHGHPWMAVAVASAGGAQAFVKGAPEDVLARCETEAGATLTPARREAWGRRAASLADEGLRVFALARRALADGWERDALDGGFELLGLAAMSDPPRPEAARSLEEARSAGLRIVMITGDHAATAHAIAKDVRLAGDAAVRVHAGDPAPDDVGRFDAFARVTPSGKVTIVRALRARGEVVGMTGDGVNDGPALATADVGIAMGRGTDVAREAASVVLVDERLAALVAATAEGRGAFFNIQRAVDYLLTCSFTTMLAVLVTTAAGFPLPLNPLQILYLNILTHSFPALGIARERTSREVLDRPPLAPGAALLPPGRLASILWHGTIVAVATLAVGAWGMTHGGEAHARTLVFATLGGALLLHAFSDRSPRPFGGFAPRGNASFFVFLASALALLVAALAWPPLRDALGMTSVAPHDLVTSPLTALLTLVAVEISKWALPPATE